MTSQARLAPRVLLIGLDGAEWSLLRPLMQEGRLPHLTRLIERGLSGSLPPILPTHAAPVWTSIATGKRPHRHGVYLARRPVVGGVAPVDAEYRAAHPLWTILTRRGLRTHCVAWPVTQPAEPINGVCVSDAFVAGHDDAAVAPADFTDDLRSLRVLPQQVQAQTMQELVGPAAMNRPAGDPLLRAAAAIIAEAATVQNVATALLAGDDWDFAAVHFALIGRASAAFMRCQAPLPAGVPPELACFDRVVEAAYLWQDLMLGRLVELAGDDTAVLVVSGHGYMTGAQRPNWIIADPIDTEAAWHRAGGVCVLAGPPFKHDELIEGVTPFDIAPTILTLLGQPYADDSDGRPLSRAFATPVRPASIASWEERYPLPASAAEASDEAWRAAEHLIALGHVDRLAEQSAHTAEMYMATLLYRSQSLIEAGEPARAVPLLTTLVRLRPNRRQFRIDLFRAAMAAGDLASARYATEGVSDEHGGPTLQLALATLAMAEHRMDVARAHLDRVATAECNADMLAIKGQAHFRLRQYKPALAAFDAALAMDDLNEKAWFGRARALRAVGGIDAATDAVRRTIALRPEFARAHVELAMLYKQAGDPDRACAALRRALLLKPDFELARRLLSRTQFAASVE